MSELKGVDLITTALNAWLIKQGFSARVREMDTDFYWYHDDDTISYSLFSTEDSIVQFDILMQELGCQYTIDWFYAAFLHELGHSHSYPNLSDEEILEDEAMKEWLHEQDESSFEENLYSLYFRIPMELVATKWAVNFINSNPNAVKELVDTVGAAVRLFYSLNEVVTEEMVGQSL